MTPTSPVTSYHRSHRWAAFLLITILSFHGPIHILASASNAVASGSESPTSKTNEFASDATFDDTKNITSTSTVKTAPSSLRSNLMSSTDNEKLENAHVDPEITSLEWPWTKNGTVDYTCHKHENCTSCNDASLACHWCSKNNECHAKGSWYGCAIGASCSNPSNDTADNTCHSHTSCTDCALSSSMCHWCVFDDGCHAIGSFYGCAHGVNCYSNDRCQRETPEKIQEAIFADIGVIPLVLIISAVMSVLCCSSIMFAGISTLKGVYDDLVEVNVPPSEAFGNHDFELELDPIHEETDDCMDGNDGNEPESGEEVEAINGGDVENELESANEHCHDAPQLQTEVTEGQLTESLLPVTAHPDPSRLPTRNRRSGSRHFNCLITTCKVWYVFTIVGALLFATTTVLFFPKAPEYNICADEFAVSCFSFNI